MRLLLVEDSQRLRSTLERGLRKLGHAVDAAADGREGLWLATENSYDAIVLDLLLPEIDGYTVLKQLRERGKTSPVLILSAKDLVEDRVHGLDLGADDYLVKPFAFEELVARLQALSRRGHQVASPALVVGPLSVDLAARRVWCDGREVRLTAREFSVLELLALRRGEVVSRRELWEHLYEFEDEAASNVVDVLVYSMRKKLEAADGVGSSRLIQTRRGQGYLLDAAPAEPTGEAAGEGAP
ncbi:MAG TPA: response regulator transcription factor [Thermoanaerobaculia bacterium]|jgi:two-component system OmpR family response regulator|nr:response regulator transcription factor [Thermoanaerobaculia bacterium]